MFKFEKDTIDRYVKSLREKSVTPNEIKRKLQSIKKFLDWTVTTGHLDQNDFKQMEGEIANTVIGPSKSEGQLKSVKISLNNDELISTDLSRFQPTSIQNYIGFAVILLLISLIGFGLYNQFFKKTATPFAYPTALTPGSRIISFQGRLTDSIGNPIIAPIDLTYNFYTVSTGGSPITGSTRVCTASPDQDGVFANLIGSDPGPSCTPELPATIFSENPQVWLGVTVGSELTEMSPRQQIANVGYAMNAETLQGFPPGTTVSTIPFISTQGDLLIAAATPGIRSTYTTANFVISSAKTTTIQSANAGDIVLSATDGGALRFNTYNGSLVERITVLSGGNVGISNVNPRAAFDVIGSASLSANLAFSGATTQIGQLNGGNISFATSPGGDAGLVTKVTLTNTGNVGIGSTLPAYLLDVSGGSGIVGQFSGRVIGGNAVNGNEFATLGQIAAGGGQYWQRTNGALSPTTLADDVLLGATSTSSAKFAFMNVNAGTPTASISGNLAIAAPSGANPATSYDILNDGTFNLRTSPGGDAGLASRLFVNNAGNVGVGSTSPQAKLDLGSTGSGYEIYFGGTGGANIYSNGAQVFYILAGTGGELHLGSNNTNDQVVLKAGDLGIGSTAPTGKLDIAQSAQNESLIIADTTASPINEVVNITRSNNAPSPTVANALLYLNDHSSNYPLYITNNVGADLFTVKGDGNVGIGTSVPSAKLDIAGDASTSGHLVFRGATPNYLHVLNGTDLRISTSPGGDAGNTDRLTLLSNGNFGIGTTSPLELLDIAGSASLSANLTIGQTGVLRSQYGPLNLAYKSGLNAWTTGLTLQDTTGNVGIGSANPGAFKLEVAGNIGPEADNTRDLGSSSRYYANIYANNIVGSGALGYWKRGVGTLYPNVTSDAIAATSSGTTVATFTASGTNDALRTGGASNYLTVGSTGSLTFNAVTNDIVTGTDEHLALMPNGTGNVGIGSSSPGYKLDVSGSILGLTDIRIGNGTNIFEPVSTWNAQISSYGDVYAMVDADNSDTSSVFAIRANGTASNVAYIDQTGSASLSANLTIGQTGVLRSQYGPLNLAYKSGLDAWTTGLTLQDTTGNVGIGSANPGAFKLEVAGNIGPEADNTRDLGSSSRYYANIYANNIVGSGALGYWKRGVGTLYPNVTSDAIAATSSGTTVATFTASGTNDALRAGGATNYATFNSSGNLTFTNAGVATITGPTTGLTIDATTGALNFGTSANARTITIGNVTTTTGVNVNTGTAGTTYTTTNGIFTLNTGTGTISLGTDAVAKTITIGNATTTTGLALNSGTGDITLTSTDQVKLNSSKAAGGTTTEALSLKSTVDLGVADELLQIGDSGADFLTILGNGNVGIGTALPSSLAHLYSTSTSTSFTGFNLDWSPGSSTTTTGDLFALNIGTNGTASTLFNVKDTGSSLFSVSETAVTSNLPTSFTSAGDVSIAYDLLFTNPTSSYIKSSAPLYIQAGEVFGSSDLTLTTYNSGDVVLDAAGGVTLSQAQPWSLATSTTALNIQSGLLNLDTTNTRVGIGTTAPTEILDVVGNASASGNITLGQTGALRSQYGPLNLAYKSALNAWTTGLTLQDTTGNVGIGSANPGAFKLEVAGNIGPEADNTRNLGSASRYFNTIYVNNIVGSGALGYWNRGVGVLYPATLTDGIAATTSATTVATFTATGSNDALRAGGTTNYATINSSGNLTFTNAGVATITGPTTGLTIDATTGAMNFGTSANARVITIGNVTGTTAVNVNTGTAGTTYTTTNGIFTLNTGTGTISLGTDAVAKTITIGNATTTTGLALNSGTGDIVLTSTDQVKLNSSKAAGGTTTEALSLKSTIDLGVADELLQIGDSAADFVTILGNGNVGIGTTSPGQKLSLLGGNLLIDANNVANSQLLYRNSTNYGASRNNYQIGGLGAMAGRTLNRNPDMLDGTTGYAQYNNAGGTKTTISAVADTTAPNSSGQILRVTYDGTGTPDTDPTPGYGGYYISFGHCTGTNNGVNGYCYRQGNRLIHRIWAKIPVGRTIAFASNGYGTGGNHQWLTSQAGTADWMEYVAVQTIGIGGTLSTTGYWYIPTDGNNIAFTWDVASTHIIAVDEMPTITRAGDLNIGYYQGKNLAYGELLNTQGAYLAASAGNVGIGTISPETKLDVVGNIHIKSGYIDMDRNNTTATGITWYNTPGGYTAWQDYMAPAGAGQGVTGTVTAPSGALVTSWAKRSFIEDAANYGWTFESGTSSSTTPTVKFEIKSSDGSFHSYGSGFIDGNVGIGTTSSSSRLHVADSGFAGSTLVNIIADDAGPWALNFRQDTAAQDWGIFVDNSDTLRIYDRTDSRDVLALDGTGNVGIGTTGPGAKLAVSGGNSFLNDQANSGASARNFGPKVWTDNLFGMELGNNGTLWTTRILTRDSDGGIEFGKYPSGSTTNVNQFSPWMTIINNGNVGIGTTSPTALLDVRGNATFSGTLSIAPMFIAAAGTCNAASTGKIYYDATLNQFYYCNGTSWTAMGGGVAGSGTLNYVTKWTPDGATLGNSVIYDTGTNVGIGTTGPTKKLEVYGSGANLLSVNAPAANQADIYFQSAGTDKSALYRPPSSNDLRVWLASPGDVMTFQQTSGNVGIGSTSPGHLFNVVGSNNTTAVGIDIGANAHFDFSANSTSGYTTTFNMDDVGLDIGHNSSSRALNLQTNSLDRLTIIGNGNVGIGSTGPRSRLDIGSNLGAGNGFRAGDYLEINEREVINNALSIGWNAYIAADDGTYAPVYSGAGGTGMVLAMSGGGVGSLDFWGRDWAGSATPVNLTAFAHVMRLSTTGNVGIGTTSTALGKLQIYAAGDGTNALTITGSSTGTAMAVISQEAAGTNTGTLKLYSGNPGVLGTLISGGTASSYFNGGGNVGIGTTTPAGKFDVRMDATWANTAVIIPTTADQNPRIALYRPTGSGANSYPWYIRGGGSSVSNLEFATGASTTIGSETVSAKMVIDSNGNVGIGSVTPSQRLDVSGYIKGNDLIINNNHAWAAQANADPSTQGSLKFSTTHTGGGNLYTYQRITNTGFGYTAVSGDYLEFDVYCSPSNTSGICDGGVEIDFVTVGGLRGLGNTDQNGISANAGNISSYGVGRWYHRKVSLAGAIGQVVDYVTVVEETDTAGNYTNYYRKIFISNGSSIKATFWDGGNPTANTLGYGSGNSNNTTVGSLYDEIYAEGSGSNYFAGNVGIGTTGGSNKLNVNGGIEITATGFPGAGDGIGKSAAGELGIVNAGSYALYTKSGNVGIGTTNPTSKLFVNLTANQLARFNDGTNASGATFQNGSILSQSSQFQIAATSTNPLSFYTGATINSMTPGTERMRIDPTTGNVGIGGALATGAELDLNGGTIISAMLCGNLAQCWLTGGSPGVDDRYVVPNGNTRIDTLEIVSDLASNAGYISFLNVDTAVKIASISANKTTGTVTIDNTTTNIIDVGYPTVPDLCVGDPYWCTGKVDAGTIDPPYTINGKKYATFLSAMTGVKEETTGFVTTSKIPDTRYQIPNTYSYIIDFNSVPEASDLWLFSKTTNLRKNLGKMTVLLTPSDDTRTWYKVDNATHSLTIYSSRPTTVSYRLTAPRFDGERWTNTNPGGSGGFELNDPDQPSLIALNQVGNVPPETFTISPLADSDSNFQFEIRNLKSMINFPIFKVMSDKTGDFIEEVGVFAQITVGQIKAGFIETENAIVNNMLLAKNIIVQEKIISPVVETTDLTATGTATLATVQTNEIQPKNDDLTIDLDRPNSPNLTSQVEKGALGRLIVKGLNDKIVASIDSAGNATFAGTLTANDVYTEGLIARSASISGGLTASEASLSGTLVAKEVKADNINSLTRELVNSQTDIASHSSTLAQLSTTNEQLSTDINAVQAELARIKNAPLPDPNYYQNIDTGIAAGSTGIARNASTLDSLTVTGNSNLYNASVANSLTAGNIFIQNNEILSLSWELKLSALAQITLFDGSVTIAKNGNITTVGEVIAKGGVRTNEIQPINEGDDLSVVLNSKSVYPEERRETLNPKQIQNSKFKIQNLESGEVASIDASGSARFNALGFNQIATNSAIIADSGLRTTNDEIIPAMQTNAEAAGQGILPLGAPEIIIYNDKITKDSLVYLTAIGDGTGGGIPAPTLTVVKKEVGERPYFSVSAGNSQHPEIKFNWLIIN